MQARDDQFPSDCTQTDLVLCMSGSDGFNQVAVTGNRQIRRLRTFFGSGQVKC